LSSPITTGLIIISYGLNFIVKVADKNYSAVSKSKKTDYVVGDLVALTIINDTQAQILELVPRRNLVMRSDKNRRKIIASNVDQLLIVIAIQPNFNPDFLDRCLVFAEAEQITPIIVINKTDIEESKGFIARITRLYQQQLGYNIVAICAQQHCHELKPLLANKTSLLIGQSGVGKSTITNMLAPKAKQHTAAINKAATSGKHTTTHTNLYEIEDNSYIIDCPGLQEFGLYHLAHDNILNYFPECISLIGQCRFRDCRHQREPECAVTTAYAHGLIDNQRFNFLQKLLEQAEK